MSKLENWISTIVPDMDVLHCSGYDVCKHKDIKLELELQSSTYGASHLVEVEQLSFILEQEEYEVTITLKEPYLSYSKFVMHESSMCNVSSYSTDDASHIQFSVNSVFDGTDHFTISVKTN